MQHHLSVVFKVLKTKKYIALVASLALLQIPMLVPLM